MSTPGHGGMFVLGHMGPLCHGIMRCLPSGQLTPFYTSWMSSAQLPGCLVLSDLPTLKREGPGSQPPPGPCRCLHQQLRPAALPFPEPSLLAGSSLLSASSAPPLIFLLIPEVSQTASEPSSDSRHPLRPVCPPHPESLEVPSSHRPASSVAASASRLPSPRAFCPHILSSVTLACAPHMFLSLWHGSFSLCLEYLLPPL